MGTEAVGDRSRPSGAWETWVKTKTIYGEVSL